MAKKEAEKEEKAEPKQRYTVTPVYLLTEKEAAEWTERSIDHLEKKEAIRFREPDGYIVEALGGEPVQEQPA